MVFITNAEQIDSRVKYYAKGGSYRFYFTKEEAVLSFIKREPKKNFNKEDLNKSDVSREEEKGIGVALALKLIDANPNVKIEGQVKGAGRVNYPIVIDPGLIYSTYLGGSSTEFGNGIAVDNTGNAYVTGQTRSGNFSTTAGAFQSAFAGNGDAFVSKINATTISPRIGITN